eukprot:scaffold14406_cov69-Phaeocystis_antarctica.AAC.4
MAHVATRKLSMYALHTHAHALLNHRHPILCIGARAGAEGVHAAMLGKTLLAQHNGRWSGRQSAGRAAAERGALDHHLDPLVHASRGQTPAEIPGELNTLCADSQRVCGWWWSCCPLLLAALWGGRRPLAPRVRRRRAIGVPRRHSEAVDVLVASCLQDPLYLALVEQHARHNHLERDYLELLDAEPRDDRAARHKDLLTPVVGAVSEQLVHGCTAAVGVSLVEQHDRVAVSERGGDLLLAVCGGEVALGEEKSASMGMGHAWGMHGACMVHAWGMHGACMAHAWGVPWRGRIALTATALHLPEREANAESSMGGSHRFEGGHSHVSSFPISSKSSTSRKTRTPWSSSCNSRFTVAIWS